VVALGDLHRFFVIQPLLFVHFPPLQIQLPLLFFNLPQSLQIPQLVLLVLHDFVLLVFDSLDVHLKLLSFILDSLFLQFDPHLLIRQHLLIILQLLGSDSIRLSPPSFLLSLPSFILHSLLLQRQSSFLILSSSSLLFFFSPLPVLQLPLRDLLQRSSVGFLQFPLLFLEFHPFFFQTVSLPLDALAFIIEFSMIVIGGSSQLLNLRHLRLQLQLPRLTLSAPFLLLFRSLSRQVRPRPLLLLQHPLPVRLVLPLLLFQSPPIRLHPQIDGGDFLLDGRHLRRRQFRQFPLVVLLHLDSQCLQPVFLVLNALSLGVDLGLVFVFAALPVCFLLLDAEFVSDSSLFGFSHRLLRLALQPLGFGFSLAPLYLVSLSFLFQSLSIGVHLGSLFIHLALVVVGEALESLHFVVQLLFLLLAQFDDAHLLFRLGLELQEHVALSFGLLARFFLVATSLVF